MPRKIRPGWKWFSTSRNAPLRPARARCFTMRPWCWAAAGSSRRAICAGQPSAAVVIHCDLERSQETMVLGGEFDFAGGFESPLGRFFGHLKLLVLTLAAFAVLVAAVETDGGLQNQKHVVPGLLDVADRLRDPVGLG